MSVSAEVSIDPRRGGFVRQVGRVREQDPAVSVPRPLDRQVKVCRSVRVRIIDAEQRQTT